MVADLVVAVDEAGDFKLTSAFDHFYIAAIVRPGKEEQFLKWEKGIPSINRKEGEVKGGYLTPDQLHDFVREVVCRRPTVIVTPFTIQPANPLGDIAAHQAEMVQDLTEFAETCRRQGNKGRAAEARDVARWIERMSQSHHAKLEVQAECVAQSLADVVGHSIVGDFDRELPSLRYKIDRGLIGDKPTDHLYWRRTVQIHARNLPENRRLLTFDTWAKQGHPFFDLYRPNGVWNFDPLFDNRCDFLDSKDHFELRIADIVASICRTFYQSTDRERQTNGPFARMRRGKVFAGLGNVFRVFLKSRAAGPSEHGPTSDGEHDGTGRMTDHRN